MTSDAGRQLLSLPISAAETEPREGGGRGGGKDIEVGSESLVFVYFFSFCLSLVIHHHPCIHASTCPSICPTYLSVHRRFLHPSTHLSVRRPSVHPSVHIFLCTRASLVLNSVWHKQPLSKYLSTRRTNGRMNHWKVRLRSREPTLPGPQWVRIGFSSPCGYRWPPSCRRAPRWSLRAVQSTLF